MNGKGRNGKMLKGTSVLMSQHVRDTLYCIGGIRVLLPLLRMRDDWTVEYAMCARILSLISEMLKQSRTNQEVIVQSDGFFSLAIILEEWTSNKHLNSTTLKALQGMLECSFSPTSEFIKQVYLNIFFNFQLWQAAIWDIQKEVILFLRDIVIKNPTYFNEVIGLQHVMDILRFRYWYQETPGSTYERHVLLDDVQIKILRHDLYDIVNAMIGNSMKEKDLNVLLKFLLDCKDDRQILELLTNLLVFLDAEFKDLLKLLSIESFYYPLLTLLHCENKNIRLFTLKLFGKILEGCSGYEKMDPNIFSVIEHYLMIFDFDKEIYTALMEIITNNISYKVLSSISNLNSTILTCPPLLPVIFNLVKGEVLEMALIDLRILLKSSKSNVVSFSKLKFWQLWVLKLLNHPAIDENTGAKKLNELILELTTDILTLTCANVLELKGEWQQFRCVFDSVDVLSDGGDLPSAIPSLKLKMIVIGKFITTLSELINNFAGDSAWNKDNESFCNIYQCLRFIEDFLFEITLREDPVSEQKLSMFNMLLKSFDPLVKASVKDSRAMSVLHCLAYEQRNASIFQSLIDFTPWKNSNVATIRNSIFGSLLRTELFMIQWLSPQDIASGLHLIRLAGLLVMDIDSDKVKIQWKEQIFESAMDTQRILYSLSKLFHSLEKRVVEIVPLTKAMLRKNKQVLIKELQTPAAKQFLSKDYNYLDAGADDDDFIMNFNAVWNVVFDCEPLLSFLKETRIEVQQSLNNARQNRETRLTQLKDDIRKADVNPQTKYLLSKALKFRQILVAEERQRCIDNHDIFRRRKTIATVELQKIFNEMLNGFENVWCIHNDDKKGRRYIWRISPTENSLRQKMILVMDPNGTNHPDANPDLFKTETNTATNEPMVLYTPTEKVNINSGSQDFPQAINDDEKGQNESIGNATSDDKSASSGNKEITSINTDEAKVTEPASSTFSEEIKFSKQLDENTISTIPCQLIKAMFVVKGNLEITNVKSILFEV